MIEKKWFTAHYTDTMKLRLQVSDTLCAFNSPYQKIEVFDSVDFGRVLALDGIINVTERDEFIYHEMLVHVPLFSHPCPERILIIGGGDGGAVREALKHDCVRQINLVEIDGKVVEIAKKYFPATSSALDDSRVTVTFDDASQFIKDCSDAFDIIIIDSTDPVGAGEKLFSEEFYLKCRNALTRYGILTAQSESPFFDAAIGKPLYEQAGRLFSTVKMYLACMPSYIAGMWSFLYCSNTCDPLEHFQKKRYNLSRIYCRYYNSSLHTASFALPSFIQDDFHI